MTDRHITLGIDIGSTAVSVAQIGPDGAVGRTGYAFHHGKIRSALLAVLEPFDPKAVAAVAATSSTPPFIRADGRCDNRIALIEAARRRHRAVGAILIIGGERFGIIHFDADGRYRSFKANTSCAAGTGSFLDQQARRLTIAGSGTLGRLAMENTGPIPKIASRCAVFAKTDLVHAQQEGFRLEAICDGLCRGMARNVVDALSMGRHTRPPVLIVGGVSRNPAVVHHVRDITGLPVIVDDASHLYGAIGAALNLHAGRSPVNRRAIGAFDELIAAGDHRKHLFHPPLVLHRSVFPDFNAHRTDRYTGVGADPENPVEVDLYETDWNRHQKACLGIDIGSTSTKAVLTDPDRRVLAGFYTRTAGRPVRAVQALLAAVADRLEKTGGCLDIVGAATTGAGRKFIGKLIGADLVLDEITAHARAAVELTPSADTIIEIGGQDAKFTTLANGMVTFSRMNHICAAGTGSFIEEQAQRLRCPLGECADRAMGRPAPKASDRCTVFMERDINYYLGEGHGVDDVLASVLHAICENYLTKVASESRIGDTVLFQGATAKNRALVAAFEQRLDRPIHVSRYCHLTGAYGAALTLLDEETGRSAFRGIDLWKRDIPITTEICDLCTNHCKLTLAHIDGEQVAYGFLCGRDYRTRRKVDRNRSGFDLMTERRAVCRFRASRPPAGGPVVGLPAALHLAEDIPFWRAFFNALSIRTVVSEHLRDAVETGKRLAGAEFCAPMAAMHGHVAHLLETADVVFLPIYMDHAQREKGRRRQFCYYTQYAPVLASALGAEQRVLTPLVYFLYNLFHAKVQLYRMVRHHLKPSVRFLDVAAAFDAAARIKAHARAKLKRLYRTAAPGDDVHVVFLGRPYTVLSDAMNKQIPHFFQTLGVRTFYQDMLSYTPSDVAAIRPLLDDVHWYYAARILEAAEVTANTEGAYPVLVTSFKCAPDSFVIEYVKKILEARNKPYLVLQLDEHDSRVGCETRIEAAVRAFRNHHGRPSAPAAPPAMFRSADVDELNRKTVLFPNWDNLSLRLVMATLRRDGIDARVLEEIDTSIQNSLRTNSGQCIPLNIITQEYIDYIESRRLDPARCILWLPYAAISCNIKLYPAFARELLDAYGNGLEAAGVYVGSIFFDDISLRLSTDVYLAYMIGGMLRKIGCRIRPYERQAGETDRRLDAGAAELERAIAEGRPLEAAIADVVDTFRRIETVDIRPNRPKVAIFGDLYARDNRVFNQELIRFIEAHGGEVIPTPYSEYMKMIAASYFRKWFFEGQVFNSIMVKALYTAARVQEAKFYRPFGEFLGEPLPTYDDSPQKILAGYGMRIEHTGESMDNILKIHYLLRRHPDIALFVQTSPAFCCPSLVTEAMARKIEEKTGVPIVSITYDGTGGSKNEAVVPYLTYPISGRRDRGDHKASA